MLSSCDGSPNTSRRSVSPSGPPVQEAQYGDWRVAVVVKNSHPCQLEEQDTDLRRRQHVLPLVNEFTEHTEGATHGDLPQPSDQGQLSVAHLHVCLTIKGGQTSRT